MADVFRPSRPGSSGLLTWVSATDRRWRLFQPSLVAAAVVVAIVVGWSAGRGSLLLVAPLVGAVCVALLARSAYVACALVVIGASTFSDPYLLPQFGRIYLIEGVALLGLAAVAIHPSRSFGRGTGVLVLVFLCSVLGGIFVAHVHGVTFVTAVDQGRVMLFYCAFWLALAALRAGHARFFAMLAGFAVFIAVLSVVQWLLPGYHVFRAEAGQAVALEGGFARIRPPGLILVYFAFLFAIAYLAWGPARQRARAGVLAAMCATALLLSLNRNMILGSVIGLITVLVVARQRRRGTVILGTLAIIAVLTLTFMGSGAVAERILSIGNRSGLQQTLAYRAYENQHAVPVIGRHPVFGIGWGTDYGALLAQNGTGALTNRSFIHNQYYGLWLRTGLLGLSAYLALLVGTAIAGIRYVRSRANHADAWIGAGLLASVVGLAASSVVGVYVIDAGSAVPAACLFALGAFLHERLREPSTASARASVERG